MGAAIAAICVLGISLAVLPEAVEAQKVANPGTFTLNSTGGAIKIGSTVNVDLAPRINAQCGDGVDNDGDGRIDAADSGCVAGSGQPQSADDSELAPGFQPKVDVTISGSINANGVISIPQANIVFPVGYIPIRNPFDGYTDVVTTTITPTSDATGTLDPLTGDAVINLAFRVRIGGTVSGNAISSNCTIGTVANPIRLNLITGTKPAIGQNNALTGSRYNATAGTAVLVENAFAVPPASSCPIAGGFDVTPNINQQMGLPSAAGRNLAYVSGRTTPALGKAVNPVILPGVPELRNNQVPYTVTFERGGLHHRQGPVALRVGVQRRHHGHGPHGHQDVHHVGQPLRPSDHDRHRRRHGDGHQLVRPAAGLVHDDHDVDIDDVHDDDGSDDDLHDDDGSDDDIDDDDGSDDHVDDHDGSDDHVDDHHGTDHDVHHDDGSDDHVDDHHGTDHDVHHDDGSDDHVDDHHGTDDHVDHHARHRPRRRRPCRSRATTRSL